MRSTTRGFTLIELIAVIAIAGVVMAVVAMNLGALTPGTRLTSSGRLVRAMIISAREEAIVSGYPIGIGYDLDEGEIWLDVPVRMLAEGADLGADEVGGRVRLKKRKLEPGVRIRKIELDASNSYNGGVLVLDVDPLGTLPAHIVHMDSENIEEEVWLQVNPLTAEVRMVYSADEHGPEPPSFREITDADFRD